MQQTVIGFFNSADDAQRAAERLKSNGFSESEIDLTTSHTDTSWGNSGSSQSSGTGETYILGDQATASYSSDGTTNRTPYDVSNESGEYRNDSRLDEDRIRSREDNDSGGFGDSIGRFFRNLFDNDDEAERYASVGRKTAIVSVYTTTGDEAMRAADIMDECGAVDVDERMRDFGGAESRGMSTTPDAGFEDRNITGDRTSDQSIPVIEENINVGKRQVETGAVRLRSRIIERPVEQTLRLREEHIRVERHPVNRPATEADFDTFREGEIEMTETSEVPMVNKEARVVEEINLNKEVTERDETISETVRKTDVDVENINEETLKTRKGGRKKL